jgi:hypothetical protein
MTIQINVTQQIEMFRAKKQRPRRAVLSWMRRNPNWYREIIAIEWEQQTGEDWLTLMEASSA